MLAVLNQVGGPDLQMASSSIVSLMISKTCSVMASPGRKVQRSTLLVTICKWFNFPGDMGRLTICKQHELIACLNELYRANGVFGYASTYSLHLDVFNLATDNHTFVLVQDFRLKPAMQFL